MNRMEPCLFCESSQSKKSYYPPFNFNNKRFEYITCKNCGLVYLSPLLNGDDLNTLYSIDYHNEFYFQQEKTYAPQLTLLKKHKPSGRLLDYGCGDASFLKYFQSQGYNLIGAEYNPAMVSRLRESNPAIEFITIQHLLETDNTTYDIIHLGDVLEHLVNPREIITRLRKKLSPGGVLFVEGPIEHNFHLAYPTRSIYFEVRKLLQPRRVVAMRPFHIFFSNRTNQKKLFEDLGMKTNYYEIFEWAWPYPASWKTSPSLKLKLEYVIGKVSVASSKMIKGWGNRFYYLGSADNNQASHS